MHVSRWGNSLAVRLPKALVEALGLRARRRNRPHGYCREATVGVRKVDPGAEFLARMAEFNVRAPKGYRFDRDEANER